MNWRLLVCLFLIAQAINLTQFKKENEENNLNFSNWISLKFRLIKRGEISV